MNFSSLLLLLLLLLLPLPIASYRCWVGLYLPGLYGLILCIPHVSGLYGLIPCIPGFVFPSDLSVVFPLFGPSSRCWVGLFQEQFSAAKNPCTSLILAVVTSCTGGSLLWCWVGLIPCIPHVLGLYGLCLPLLTCLCWLPTVCVRVLVVSLLANFISFRSRVKIPELVTDWPEFLPASRIRLQVRPMAADWSSSHDGRLPSSWSSPRQRLAPSWLTGQVPVTAGFQVPGQVPRLTSSWLLRSYFLPCIPQPSDFEFFICRFVFTDCAKSHYNSNCIFIYNMYR